MLSKDRKEDNVETGKRTTLDQLIRNALLEGYAIFCRRTKNLPGIRSETRERMKHAKKKDTGEHL